MKNEVVLLLLLLTLPILLTPVQSQGTSVSIIASTSIVADAVNTVGGEHVEVITLIEIGVDPHDFEPTPSDIQAINDSDYIFWLGGGVEESIANLLHFWEDQGKATELIETIDDTQLLTGDDQDHDDANDEGHGDIDPHFWMSPILWKQTVEEIVTVLMSIDTNNADVYNTKGSVYLNQLDLLHSNITMNVNQLDNSDKFLVTEHDSFSYFAETYNFTTRSLQGISTNTEAGIREIDTLAAYLEEYDIEVVFTESTSPGENIKAVIDAARSMGHTVVIGGQLFAGSLSDEADKDSYLEMMLYNTETIVSAILSPPEATGNPLPISSLLFSFVLSIGILVFRRRVYHG